MFWEIIVKTLEFTWKIDGAGDNEEGPRSSTSVIQRNEAKSIPKSNCTRKL